MGAPRQTSTAFHALVLMIHAPLHPHALRLLIGSTHTSIASLVRAAIRATMRLNDGTNFIVRLGDLRVRARGNHSRAGFRSCAKIRSNSLGASPRCYVLKQDRNLFRLSVAQFEMWTIPGSVQKRLTCADTGSVCQFATPHRKDRPVDRLRRVHLFWFLQASEIISSALDASE